MSLISIISISLICCLGGAGTLYFVRRSLSDTKIKNAEKQADRLVRDSEKRVRQIEERAERDAREAVTNARRKAEDDERNRRREIDRIEGRVLEKEKLVDAREVSLRDRDNELLERIEKAKDLRGKQEEVLKELYTHLEKAAQLSKEEAEQLLLTNVEKNCRQRAGVMIKEIEAQARKVADRKSKEIVLDAIERTAVEHVQSSTTAVVSLPDDEMKGRIIGREGRNIRSFESTTGVDVIIDDTPNGVILSAFDPIRREIARMAMDTLVKDGRINPARVEEAVDKAREDLDVIIKGKGEKAVEELGIDFHPKFLELFGRLFYRTSYGQNILSHSLETAHIAGNIAAELGVNVNLAKRGGMLHDVGKAIDFEMEGSHDDLGAEMCKKYGESDEVINCIMAHHEDEDPDTVEAVIVKVADAISSARPGARKESVEKYIKRLQNLEKLVNSYECVDKAFAIQAGREVRIMVRPDEIDDEGIHKVAMDIAKRIEDELDYPGEVKVSIVRETRATSVAH
ncbi:ribonuclease Y [bacterium]|jgi:ribonucrease Y|nr:ribonuclease Y [bacterium]